MSKLHLVWQAIRLIVVVLIAFALAGITLILLIAAIIDPCWLVSLPLGWGNRERKIRVEARCESIRPRIELMIGKATYDIPPTDPSDEVLERSNCPADLDDIEPFKTIDFLGRSQDPKSIIPLLDVAVDKNRKLEVRSRAMQRLIGLIYDSNRNSPEETGPFISKIIPRLEDFLRGEEPGWTRWWKLEEQAGLEIHNEIAALAFQILVDFDPDPDRVIAIIENNGKVKEYPAVLFDLCCNDTTKPVFLEKMFEYQSSQDHILSFTASYVLLRSSKKPEATRNLKSLAMNREISCEMRRQVLQTLSSYNCIPREEIESTYDRFFQDCPWLDNYKRY